MDFLEKLRIKDNEKLAMQPRVISIQRKKLLIALKEIPDEPISEDEIQYVIQYEEKHSTLDSISRMNIFKPRPCSWQNDAEVNEKIDELLKTHAHFQLSKYLDHAEVIFLAYSGVTVDSPGKSMEYILTHSRQFGHPQNKIFETDYDGNDHKDADKTDGFLSAPAKSPQLPNSKVFNEIGQLMRDLKSAYDERKFQILNANVTYFTLLMLRRFVKNSAQFLSAFKKIDIHDSYVKICPFPLDKQLPKCGFVNVVERFLAGACQLAVAAYLRTSEAVSKRALRTTCVLHVEWYGLHLPRLFFRVLELYAVTAGRLFDTLLYLDWRRDTTLDALNRLTDTYYRMHQSSKAGHTHDWFPFCRLVNNTCECHISANECTVICIILAYLVDLKLGFDKSTIRQAHWVKPHFKEACKQVAELLQKKLESN